jgi:hypothetical protein
MELSKTRQIGVSQDDSADQGTELRILSLRVQNNVTWYAYFNTHYSIETGLEYPQ